MTDLARLVVYLEPALAEAFVDLARANDRSATAEARIALKRHMKAEGVELPPDGRLRKAGRS